ncbi:MAG: methylenetetrahydrofolate reductase C-terminal domain-containing protein [Gammaproteobacteria bacterium]|nr:methylenetetrahydrofolate reductase C-terminal domain-containing protein [Gammaproteobacteria bacterium]
MPLLFDKLIKEPLFGCQQCGQCLLSQSGYICPMTCPKGLRNGPCGGTLNGACEVLPDQPCVWLRIRDKSASEEGVHAPFDPALVGSSSLTNYLSGRDRETRKLLDYRVAAGDEASPPSQLAQSFGQGQVVITYEITSPRDRTGLDRIADIVKRLDHHVDGINTTTNAGGVESLHSLETARLVARTGVPPIVQFCGRDQAADEFLRQATSALEDGFANILALTGDWNPHDKRERHPAHWFPMDSLQMVDILAEGSGFIKAPFIGVASNPYTTPMDVSVDRLRNKLLAGAHFTQTQIVTEADIFARWLTSVRATKPGRECRILASVPLVGRQRPYEILQKLPGVFVDGAFRRTLESDHDLAVAGIAAARSLIAKLLKLDIDGVHLLNFGMPIEAVIDLVEEIRSWPNRRAA